ncbi:MAG: hypothetical protein HPY52_04060 [Firmicutes bacterium]|nr:hypothetical protein [Bacillota bacterium]
MVPLKKGSTIYGGIGTNGIFRTCKFDYHSDRTPVASGTASAIARALKFKDVKEMKDYLDTAGWRRKR